MSEIENTFNLNEEKKVTISIEEVKLIINFIDVITKRGGFTPRDFLAVGKLYEEMCKKLEN